MLFKFINNSYVIFDEAHILFDPLIDNYNVVLEYNNDLGDIAQHIEICTYIIKNYVLKKFGTKAINLFSDEKWYYTYDKNEINVIIKDITLFNLSKYKKYEKYYKISILPIVLPLIFKRDYGFYYENGIITKLMAIPYSFDNAPCIGSQFWDCIITLYFSILSLYLINFDSNENIEI